MASRGVMQSGSATSPFRIYASGANVADPLLEDILFDGDQQPFRVKQKGVIVIANGPGFASSMGAYAGNPTPISNPHPTKRHLVLGLGRQGGGVAMTPWQYSMPNEYANGCGSFVIRYENQGVGVGTDATQVWGMNYQTYVANLGVICTLGGSFPITIYGPVSYSQRSATVAYCLLHNTIG